MEYRITTDLPFDEIEALTIHRLEQQGVVVRRTFSLRSAVKAGEGSASTLTPRRDGATEENSPGFSVLMLYEAGAPGRLLGLLTLYERGGQTVIHPLLRTVEAGQSSLSPGGMAADTEAGEDADQHAALIAALALYGLK